MSALGFNDKKATVKVPTISQINDLLNKTPRIEKMEFTLNVEATSVVSFPFEVHATTDACWSQMTSSDPKESSYSKYSGAIGIYIVPGTGTARTLVVKNDTGTRRAIKVTVYFTKYGTYTPYS